jgi:hypothetical protein
VKSVERICLIQPANPWRVEIYLPGTIVNLGSRLLGAGGYEVEILDFNLTGLSDPRTREILLSSDRIGFTVLGTPIIPRVRELVLELRKLGYTRPVLVGGEGVTRLTHEQFDRIFMPDVYGDVRHVANDEDLKRALDVTLKRIPGRFEVSMRPMLERLPPELLKAYLSREFCLFTSQGCGYICDFCAASKGQREEYRDLDRLMDEVDCIAGLMAKYGLREMNVYLSNLDGLQTPHKLEEALQMAHSIAVSHGIDFRARMLATTKLTKRAIERDPQILHRLRRYGLHTIGFGVDGVSEAVWKRLHKGHNSLAEYESCRAACTAAGMRTEMLMVVGFSNESWRDGLAAIAYSIQNAYGSHRVIVRPYMAKEDVPGSKKWETDEVARERFLTDPEGFRHQEYTMFLTAITAPEWKHRLWGNLTFGTLLLTMIPAGLSTYPIIPPPRKSRIGRALVGAFNRLMPPDR